MRFLVLGPLEVIGEGGQFLPITGAKERTILADLIAGAGRVVSVAALIEELWGEDPPRTAEKTLGSTISRLRRALDPDRPLGSTPDVITTRRGGYLLEVEMHEIDAVRFERLVEAGRRLIDSGRHREAPRGSPPRSSRAPTPSAWRAARYRRGASLTPRSR
jgi:SARP family transcriptional regulator, regulator of embCAB operon